MIIRIRRKWKGRKTAGRSFAAMEEKMGKSPWHLNKDAKETVIDLSTEQAEALADWLVRKLYGVRLTKTG
jgi:hypothetical protein